MTRTTALADLVDEWPVPAFWRRAQPAEPASTSIQAARKGLLSRILCALLAADAHYRDARHADRLCDRMRRDVGLPPRGAEVLRLQRQMLEWQRWC